MGQQHKTRCVWIFATCICLGLSPINVSADGRVKPDVDAATARYKEGLELMADKDYLGAAEAFSDAFDLVPTSQREVRAGVLFDLVQAQRKAASGDGEAPESSSRHLCDAREKLNLYLADITQQYGDKSEKFRDTRKAKKLLTTVEQEIVDAGVVIPEACATLDEEPQVPKPDGADEGSETSPTPDETTQPGAKHPKPKPKTSDRALVISGAALLGSSGIFWGMLIGGLAVGNGADRDGNLYADAGISAGTPVSENDPALLDIEKRGLRGNRVAIAGGIIGTALAATGAALLVVGLRRRGRTKQVAWFPLMGPEQVGVGLAARF